MREKLENRHSPTPSLTLTHTPTHIHTSGTSSFSVGPISSPFQPFSLHYSLPPCFFHPPSTTISSFLPIDYDHSLPFSLLFFSPTHSLPPSLYLSLPHSLHLSLPPSLLLSPIHPPPLPLSSLLLFYLPIPAKRQVFGVVRHGLFIITLLLLRLLLPLLFLQ